MADQFSYSASFEISPQSSDNRDRSRMELIAFDACDEYVLTDRNVLLRAPRTGKQTAVRADVLVVLKQCGHFRTVEQHVAHVSRLLPELRGREGDIRQMLEAVRQAGLLVTHEELVAHLASTVQQVEHSVGLPVVAIITCDRPEMLRRCLGSLLANCDMTRLGTVFVVDDSRKEENRASNRRVISELVPGKVANVRYVGADEQSRLLSLLTEDLPECAEDIRFLLGPRLDEPSPGRSRNLAQLLSVNRRALILDDDIVCAAYRCPNPRGVIEISARHREAEFFGGLSDWEAYRNSERLDPLSEHATYLGKTLGHCLAGVFGSNGRKRHVLIDSVADVCDLSAGARIMVTACGTYGEPGISNTEWLYYLDAQSSRRLFESRAQYEQACFAPNAWLGRSAPHLARSYPFMSPITGLDNRHTLPPYFPLHRNEDALFGNFLGLVYPDALVMDFDWGVPHYRPQRGRVEAKAHSFSLYPGLLTLTGNCVKAAFPRVPGRTVESRLQVLAEILLDLSEESDEHLRRRVAAQTVDFQTSRLNRLSEALKEHVEAPEYWVEDMRKGIHFYQSALGSAVTPRLEDWRHSAQTQDLTSHLRVQWKNYGSAIAAWAKIRQTAAAMRSSWAPAADA